jgi:hypothetical protein
LSKVLRSAIHFRYLRLPLSLSILLSLLLFVFSTVGRRDGPGLSLAAVALLLSSDNFMAAGSTRTDMDVLSHFLLSAPISGPVALIGLESGRWLSAQFDDRWTTCVGGLLIALPVVVH